MNIYFGENLRRLRIDKELTQEALANTLGVSFQTISKWERGDTYPDITMLPKISSFFGVSIDDLLGVNRVENENKIKEYLDKYETMHFKKAPELLKEFEKASKEFPNDYRILVRYMELLIDEKDILINDEFERNSKIIMSIYDNIQKHCTDDNIRIWSKRLAIFHMMIDYACTHDENGKYYYKKDIPVKANKILSSMPSMCDSKEYLSSKYDFDINNDISSSNKKLEKSIEEITYLLQNNIEQYCYYNDNFTPEYKINVIKHMNEIIKIIDKDYEISKNRIHLIYNYGQLGRLYTQISDYENSLKYLKMSAEYAKEFDNQPEISEKLLRYFGWGYMYKQMDNMSVRMKSLMTEHYHLPDEVKNTKEFKDIIEYLDTKVSQ